MTSSFFLPSILCSLSVRCLCGCQEVKVHLLSADDFLNLWLKNVVFSRQINSRIQGQTVLSFSSASCACLPRQPPNFKGNVILQYEDEEDSFMLACNAVINSGYWHSLH